MKKILFALLLVSAVGFTSCNKDLLETAPTDKTSGDVLLGDADKAMTVLNGIYRAMYSTGWAEVNVQQDFGPASYALMGSLMGEDMIMSGQGSGWFWYDHIYNIKAKYTSKSWRSYGIWNFYYTIVSNCNYIIAAEESMTGTPDKRNSVIGQAYALRAYAYFELAQRFARTYKGHEEEYGLPLYDKPSSSKTEGQARSTVAKTYEMISNDIKHSVELFTSSTTKQAHKSHIDKYVALGIQARIALVMNDWGLAASAAKEARTKSGLTLTNNTDLVGGFNDVKMSSVMWGAEIIEDQSTGWANFFSNMDAAREGYAQTARKCVYSWLHGQMGTKDARQAWWRTDIKEVDFRENGDSIQYCQSKFRYRTEGAYASDYLYMRAEEMLLIEAEALCQAGTDAPAQVLLKELLDIRDPDNAVAKSAKTGNTLAKMTNSRTTSLLDEIIIQRRLELWGEVGRINDITRLKQGFARDYNHTDKTINPAVNPAAALSTTLMVNDPESYAWILTIPQAEFDGNINMKPEQQNPLGSTK